MAARPSRPRIDPVTDVDGELAEILSTALTHDGTPLNVFGVLGRHPKLLKRFNVLGGYLLNKGLVPERERELVILRVGWNAQSSYEFGQHTVLGRRCGLSDDEIRRITLPAEQAAWADDDLALITMADDLCRDDCVTEATWQALAGRWSDEQLIELVVLAGFYRLVSGFLNSVGVEHDPDLPGFPA